MTLHIFNSAVDNISQVFQSVCVSEYDQVFKWKFDACLSLINVQVLWCNPPFTTCEQKTYRFVYWSWQANAEIWWSWAAEEMSEYTHHWNLEISSSPECLNQLNPRIQIWRVLQVSWVKVREKVIKASCTGKLCLCDDCVSWYRVCGQ